MKAYIKKDNNVSLFEQARCGFQIRGYEIQYYEKFNSILDEDDVVVGYIEDIEDVRKIMGYKEIKQINYPEPLKKYLKRDIRVINATIHELATVLSITNKPFFIKPTGLKTSSGEVIEHKCQLTQFSDGEFYFTDTILNIIAEYRVYVIENEIIGIKHYKGSHLTYPNEHTILKMIDDYRLESPSAYSMDVAVLAGNEIAFIECNNAYSSGNYGLSDFNYAMFLKEGFNHIKKH